MSAVPETRPGVRPLPAPKRITAERFYNHRDQEGHELVAGRVLELRDDDGQHGWVISEVAFLLNRFVRERKLGAVVVTEGFVLDKQNVRKPDISFIPSAQWRESAEEGFLPYAPPLAIEVVSRTDAWSEVEGKARKYLDAGSREVWIVSRFSRTVHVWRAGAEPFIVAGDRHLESPELLPGFSEPVSAFFPQYTSQS